MDFKTEIYNRQVERFRNLSFDKLVKDREFRLYLGSLGFYSGDPDTIFGPKYTENGIKTSYWTKTRWRIERSKNKLYILSPAFYEDDEMQVRFAIRFENDELELRVYVETPEKKKILNKIGCYKILIDYSLKGEKLESSKIKLSPWDELSVTISNLDAFFWEPIPIYESFDLNIIHQAFCIVLDKGFATGDLLKIRCEEILEIINNLINDEEMFKSQIYIQIKALIDYSDIEGDWFEKLFFKMNLLDYLYEIYNNEDDETKLKISYLIEKRITDKILQFLLKNFDISNSNLKKKIFWFFGCIRSPKVLLFFEQSLDFEDKELMDKIILILLEIGSIDGYLILFKKFSKLKLEFKTRILTKIDSSFFKLRQILDQLTADEVYQFEYVVYSLLDILKTEADTELKIKIIEIIGKVGLKKVEPILELLNDKNTETRSKAAEALGRIGEKKSIKPLILLLNDESSDVQIKVIEALGDLGKGEPLIVSPLIKKLQSKNWDILLKTINSLGILEDEKAVEPLISFLDHSDPKIRLKALEALGKMNPSLVLSNIIKKLDDNDPIIRAKSAELIGLLGTTKIAEHLLHKLNDINQVKIEVIRALGFLREAKALDQLIIMLNNEPINIKKEIIIALGKIQDRKAIPHLLKQVKEKELRGIIIWALSEIEDDIKIKIQIKKLQSNDLASKLEVLDYLENVDSEKIIPPLIICLNDVNEKINLKAKEILLKLSYKALE